MLLGLVTLCAVAGAVLVIMTMGDDDSGEAEAEAASESGTKEVVAVPTNDNESPTPASNINSLALDDAPEITISLDTVPPRAEVFRAGESVGMTPLTRRFEKGEGVETWQLFLDGYAVEEIEVEMDADFHSEVVLTKLDDDTPRSKRPTASDAKERSDDSDDEGSSKEKSEHKKSVKKNDSGTRAVIGTTGASIPD